MEINSGIHVVCKDGDLSFTYGKALSSFSYKQQEKFTLRRDEVPILIKMMQNCIEEYDRCIEKIKTVE